MNLLDWLEKARTHKYISRTPKKGGKGYDYTYADQQELPLKPRQAKPKEPTEKPAKPAAQDKAEKWHAEAEAAYKRGRKALADGNIEAARVQSIFVGEHALKAKKAGLSKEKYDQALRARDALLSAYRKEWQRRRDERTVEKPKEKPVEPKPEKVTPKQTSEAKEALNAGENNEKVFGLASDVVRAAIPKADRDATLKAAKALLELAKQPGQKGKVLGEIRALSVLARTQAKLINNRYNADRNRDKPPQGRDKLYTYEDVLKARGVRDLLDRLRSRVSDIKAGKKVEKPTQEVKAELKPPPEAKAEPKKEESEKGHHKEPNFRGFTRQGFTFDIPGTRMTASVDQDPDVKSMSRYEALKMTVKNNAGEVQGYLKLGMDRDVGELLTENAQIEGDIPSAAKPVLFRYMAEGIAKLHDINQQKLEEKLRPKPKEQPQAEKPEQSAGAGAGEESPNAGAVSIPLKARSGKSIELSADDPMYASQKALIEATKDWWGEDHTTAAKAYRAKAKEVGGAEGKRLRHLANAHQGMAQWRKDRAKYPGTAAAASPAMVGHHLDLKDKVRKSASVDDWLIQADDDELEKSYDAIKNAYEKKYGAGAWAKIEVPKEVEESKAKPEKLPFGSKTKLGPEEKHRYTEAKRRLAGSLGMPKTGWGLYGRSIVAGLKNKEKKAEEKTEKAMYMDTKKSCGSAHKAMDAESWAQKAEMADDGKPGKSLQETSTEELKATLAKLRPTDSGAEARIKAIKAELASRGDKEVEKAQPSATTNLSPEKARQMLHEHSGGHGRPITEQQRKFFGAIGGHLPAPGEKAKKSMDLDDWIEKALPTHEPRMGGPKSDMQGGSQDGGDWEGKGKTPDNNGGPVNAAGMDAQGNVTGVDPGKQEKLSEDDEEQGEIGKPEKKKPIEQLGKSELYPAPLTPARQREMMAHDIAKLRKSPEMVTVGPQNHPYGYDRTMGADHEQLSKSEGSTDIPRLSYSPGQSLAQSHVLCKSVHADGCDAIHSAMLTACPECGAGTTRHRIWPNSSEVQVIPVAGPGGLRPAKRDPMIKIR